MVSTEDRALYERLASLPGWTIAEHFGCSFSGDSNPIDHGGSFYDPRDWEPYGHASVVEFWTDPEDDNVLHVQRGTVHKPDSPGDWDAVWSCCGITEPADRASVHAQIDATRSYHGIEPDGTRYPDVMTYRLSDWAEWRIWRSVAGWLAALGPGNPPSDRYRIPR